MGNFHEVSFQEKRQAVISVMVSAELVLDPPAGDISLNNSRV